MKSKKALGVVCVLIVLLILAGCGTGSGTASPPAESGYLHAVFEGTTDKGAAFLACGAGGRLDRIYEDGSVETIPLPVGDSDLTSILSTKDITIVAGASGSILYSRDGKEFALASGAGEEYITGLAKFNGKYYASAYSGRILTSEDGAVWKIGERLTKEPLVGIAANYAYVVTTTEKTDIIRSADGDSWESWNYNDVYKGLAADIYSFTNLESSGDFFYFIGQPKRGSFKWFTVMYSETAGQEDPFRFAGAGKINDQEAEKFAPLTVSSVVLFGDSLMAACSGGRLLFLDSCESCCLMKEVSGPDSDMRCIALSDGNRIIFIGGDNFDFNLVPREDILELAE